MRIRALVVRIVLQFLHDKRSLALMFIAPLMILLLMSLIFNGETYSPKLGTYRVPAPFAAALEDQGAELNEFETLRDGESALEDGKIDALIAFEEGSSPAVTLEGSDPSVSRAVLVLLQSAVKSIVPSSAPEPAVRYLHGSPDMSAFDSFGPVLVGLFSFFFVFLLSGIAFLRERTGGTLERLLASPIRRTEVVAGYLIGFGLFAILQSALVAWFAIDILDMMSVGPFWLVMLVTLILALTALTLGTLLSAYAANEFQMVQFIPLVIVPQVFFSGLFNLDTVADWLRPVSYAMPLYYGADALQGVMVRGEGMSEIAVDLYVLLGLSVVFAALNVVALRKHRKL
jgi:ABC-type multidrug transport system, permease component